MFQLLCYKRGQGIEGGFDNEVEKIQELESHFTLSSILGME